MAHSHAEVPSLRCPQCGASFTAEIGLSGDEDKLREAPAAAVPPAVAEVVGTSVQEVNSELTGRAGAELVTLEAAMAVAVVGAGKKGGKRRLAPAVMLGLLGASLLASCAPVGTQTVEPGVTIVQPEQTGTEVQGGVVIVPTEEPTEQPEAVASLTPKVVGMMAESPNESGWLPPTIEDTILTNQAGGGELPPQLQPLIDQAQATIAVTGFAQARVETVTNGQNSDAFRAAFVFRIPEGVIWAQGSAYPSQLTPDGSVSRSYAYVLVPGSADARIEWTPGADGSPDTETTLVKHTANLPDGRQAALLYWHTTEQTWKPIGGYPTAQEFVAVGDTIYQFSPEDGSAVEIGVVAGLQSLNTNNGRVEATDANGQVFWFEEGRFVNEALLAAEATPAPELGTVQQSENGNTQVMTESGWQDLVQGHAVLNGQPYTYENERLAPVAFPSSLASSINSGEISIASVGEVEQASGPRAAFFDAEGNMVAYWSEWRGDYVQARFVRENGTIIDVVPSDKIKELNDLETLKANPESVPILVLPSASLMPPQDGSPIDTGTMFIAYSSEGTAVGYNLMGVRPLKVALETWNYLINNTPYSVPVMRLSFAYRVDNEEVKTGEFVYSRIALDMPGNRFTEFDPVYNRIDDAKVVVGGIAILPSGYSDFKGQASTDLIRNSLPHNEMSYAGFQSLLSEGNFVLGDFDDGSNQFWPTRIDLTDVR